MKIRDRIIARFRADRLEQELLNSCLIGRNLAIVYAGKPMSADHIIEELMKSSNVLKPTYARMLSLYRAGRDEEAFALLPEMVPIKAASNFSLILSKMDRIDPAELSGYMEAFEMSLSDERVTKGMKREERKSLIGTVVSTMAVFAVLMNFTTVVVFLDAAEMLKTVF